MNSNRYQRERDELLHQYGFVLRRDRRHLDFSTDDGIPYVISKTPSTQRAFVQQLSDLKKVIRRIERSSDPLPPSQPSEPAVPEQQPSKRFAPPNNPARPRAEVQIPKLGPVEPPVQHIQVPLLVPANSIVQVLMAADQSEEFWKLDSCGRIRALMRAAGWPRSDLRIEVLPAQFIKASAGEIFRHFGMGELPEDGLEYVETPFHREAGLYLRTMGEWGYTGVPSLLVRDPWIGPVLVESSAWSALENTDYLFLRYGDELEGTSYGCASFVWDAKDPRVPPAEGVMPDHFIYTTFITTGMMERKGFTLQTCGAWVNPALTRNAVREIREIMRHPPQ